LVHNGVTGYLVPQRDAEAMGDAIRRLAEDESLRADLCRRGEARARTLTWGRTADEMLAIYREAL
jgi:phosphatidylinositol alpha 1,6-mannosyltransferase